MADGALEVRRYTPADEPDALALDRVCGQGGDYHVSARRVTFRRRAERFDDWRIFTGRVDGRLVAVAGIGTKPVTLFRRRATAAVGFDLRVHPAFRGRGLGAAVARPGLEWARARADLVYAWVADDNPASRAVLRRLGVRPLARYDILVYPTHRLAAPRRAVRTCTRTEAHEAHLHHAGPFDLWCDLPGGRSGGDVAAWTVHGDGDGDLAACVAWDGSAVAAEVVEALPAPLALAGAAFRRWPLRHPRLPRIPRPGDRLRSWYLHDLVATRPDLGRDLVRHVAARARERGIDFLYLVHLASRDSWIRHVRKDHPRVFAPILGYRMWGVPVGDHARLPETAYIDTRDL